MAADWLILPAVSGSIASFLIWVSVGAMTKTVRKKAMPTSTWLGGAVGVPRPVRMKPRTTRIRVNPVTVNSRAGISVSPATIRRSWTALEPFMDGLAANGARAHTVDQPAHASLQRDERCVGVRPARPGRVGRGLGLGEPERESLLLGVRPDGHDALLGD